MKTLELTSDPVFKSFMLSENTINYKARLIHLITGIPEEVLKSATYTSEEKNIGSAENKIMRTDIIVTIKGHIINLEMNESYYKALLTKNSKYIHLLSGEDLNSGENYLEARRIIQINIDDFHKYNGNKLIYEFMMREKDTGEIENDLIVSYHIDLKNLSEECYNDNEIEKIFRLFLNKDIESLRGDKIMDEAINELETISQDPDVIGLYDAEKVDRKLMNSRLLEAKEEGQQTKSLEIAKKLIEDGMDIEKISKITDLDIDTIKKIID